MSFFSRLFRSKPKLMTWQEFVEYFARRIQEELDLEAKIDWGETIALQAFEDSAYAISTQLYQYHNGTISVFRAN